MWRVLTLLAALLPAGGFARAETFLTQDQALALVFEKPAGARKTDLPDGLRAFTGEMKKGGRGVAFIDAVIGKHEPITYLVAVNADGEVQRVEILEYREAYGGEIRQASWREQFKGAKSDHPPEHGGEIRNIAGATLSCKHVTEGVAKVLKTFEENKERLLGGK